MVLELRDIHKTFAGPEQAVRALAGVEMRVGPGEFDAIQGPSGSGKSTLLLIAGGLLQPDAGTACVKGANLYAQSSEARAQLRAERIGFVFQQFHLVPYLTVLENILAPALARSAPDAERRARELAERFGLTPRLRHVPAQLSTGERQRVALARALLHRPALLLADEPTGNLDQASADTVLGFIEEYARDGGAVLLVTHDAQAAARARRRWRLDAGRLAAAPAEVNA
jgi:ABC-type lipoprotein export system ATPase subunit